MDNLVLNDFTRRQIDLALGNISHAYLFAGSRGLGKTTLAKKFAYNLLGDSTSEGDRGRWIMSIEPYDSKKISLKQTASIKDFIHRTKPKNISYKVVIIDQADIMSIEAANSLLLSLEEPTSDTVFILVAENISNLPNTILSRVQKIEFRNPSVDVLKQKLAEAIPEIDQLLDKIGPYPASLLKYNNNDYDQVDRIYDSAIQFFDGGLSERLKIANSIKERIEVQMLLDQLSTKVNSLKDDFTKWFKMSNSLILAHIHLYNNGNPKFILENLALEFE